MRGSAAEVRRALKNQTAGPERGSSPTDTVRQVSKARHTLWCLRQQGPTKRIQLLVSWESILSLRLRALFPVVSAIHPGYTFVTSLEDSVALPNGCRRDSALRADPRFGTTPGPSA